MLHVSVIVIIKLLSVYLKACFRCILRVFISYFEADDGWHNSKKSSSSLLATGPFDSQLCCQWPVNVRHSAVPVLCVWSVSACDLDHFWPERRPWQSEYLETSGCVLVCCLWIHPWHHWRLVLSVLCCNSRRPELPVTAVWVWMMQTY